MKTKPFPFSNKAAELAYGSILTRTIPHPVRPPARTKKWLALLSLVLCAGAAQAQIFTYDNGAVSFLGGEPGGDLLALNHFNTGGSSDLVTSIGVLWNPLSAGDHPTVALYSDPNGDGNPSDMKPLLIQPINIPPGVVVLNNTTVQWYSINPTVVTGSFFVGAFFSDQNASSPGIGVCSANLGPGQSWVVENTSAGHLSLQNPISTASDWENLNVFTPGNHMIEAAFSPVPEPSTLALMALGWLGFVASQRRGNKRGEGRAERQNVGSGE